MTVAVPKTLIDGYNLLFQSQLVGKGRGRQWLPAARRRLVQLLHGRLSTQVLQTTRLVFDAPSVGPAPEPEQHSSGLQVVYAVNYSEADDLLEEIIRQHPTPKQLTVVSSDQRIRRCAQARRAVSLDSETFLEQLQQGTFALSQPALKASSESSAELLSPEPEQLSEDEIAYWLKEFGA